MRILADMGEGEGVAVLEGGKRVTLPKSMVSREFPCRSGKQFRNASKISAVDLRDMYASSISRTPLN